MSTSRTQPGSRSGSARRTRLLAALGLAGLLGGMAAIVIGSGSADGGPAATTAQEVTTATAPTPVVKPPARVKVAVTGVGAYDPEGDRSENDSEAVLATDGDPATGWKSERYRSSFSKSGVGLVLDAGGTVTATRLLLTTSTPGYSAEVQAGESPDGPFLPVAAARITTSSSAFTLAPRPARYLVIWITSMPDGGVAAVDEVAVTARG